MRILPTLACGAALALTAACSTPQPLTVAPAPTTTAAPRPTTTPTPTVPAATPAATSATSAIALHLDPKHPLSTQRSVFFDYDVFTIKPEYVALIERHGRYLAANPALTVRIEGNADERGGTEYNLALGQKRAQSVVSALRLLGVRDSQMEAVSWGKERPRNPGHDEAAWAENRRADIVYARR